MEGLLAPRPRWSRLRWRLGLTAAVVVAVAAGSLVVESAGRVDEHGRPHAVLPGLPVAAPANAVEALNRAASVAAARPFPTARPDQWFYVELRSPRQGAPTLVSRMWVRADGKQMAGFRGPESTIDNQRVVVATMTSPFAPAGHPTLASLPTDPKVLLAVVRRTIRRNQASDQLRNEGPLPPEAVDAAAFGTLEVALLENVLPPKVEAAIFHAVARIPGVTLVRDAVNVDGRPALSLGRVIDGWRRRELLLDRQTYRLVGARDVVIKDHVDSLGPPTVHQRGTVEGLFVRTVATIVDRPGQTG